MEKICKKCEKLLVDSEFYRCNKSADGFQTYCKECKKSFAATHKPRLVQVSSKTCTDCGIEKPLVMFGKCSNTLDRHRSDCKVCKYSKDKEYRKKNPHIKLNGARKHRAKYRAIYNFRSMMRYARRKLAVPSWLSEAQKEEMKSFYIEAKRLESLTGLPHEVDHILPIEAVDPNDSGTRASGLHVPWNLRVVPRFINRSKCNRYVMRGDLCPLISE